MKNLPDMRVNWKTTLVGLVLIVAGLVSVFYKNCTWTEAMLAITSGVGLLMSRDHDK